MIQFTGFSTKVQRFQPHEVIAALGKVMAKEIEIVADKLGLPIEVWTNGREIDVRYPETDQLWLTEKKEMVRAYLLNERKLDIMLVRRIMKVIFGNPNSIEEV